MLNSLSQRKLVIAPACAFCSLGNRRFPRRRRTVTPKMSRLNALPFSRLHTRLAHAPEEIEDFHVAIVVLNSLSLRKLVIAPASACFAQRVQSHYVSLRLVRVRTTLCSPELNALPSRASHTFALALLNVCSRTTFRFARVATQRFF